MRRRAGKNTGGVVVMLACMLTGCGGSQHPAARPGEPASTTSAPRVRKGGPLDAGVPAGAGAPIPTGTLMTFGIPMLWNRGIAPAVIDSVALVNPKGLSLKDTSLHAFDNDEGQPVAVAGYPPKSPHLTLLPLTTPLPFARTVDDGMQLMMGVRLDRPDMLATADGVRIRYHVGPMRYELVADDHIDLCDTHLDGKLEGCGPG